MDEEYLENELTDLRNETWHLQNAILVLIETIPKTETNQPILDELKRQVERRRDY